jgi:hypothetical protein
LKLLADWMARGGGVFATGDHSILGASMCSRIPRVRTMRKWTHQQDVPTRDGPSRHQTLQPPAEQEDDTVLQPIELVHRRVGSPVSFPSKPVPHPILVSAKGVIDQFPDHMHEGEVIADGDVALDLPLDIPGHDQPEYPFAIPVVSPNAALDARPLRRRPVPHVIAYGRTTNRFAPEATTQLAFASGISFPGPSIFTKRFGLVSTYDGDSVELGRVVVDSTWHHWFSLNLLGIAESNTPAYQKMQAYYRNVALWLARPNQRQSMLFSATWGVLVMSAPMEFSPSDNQWEIGERILAALEQTASRSMLGSFVASFLPQLQGAFSASSESSESVPAWTAVSDDLMSRAFLGGVGSALVDLAFEQREIRSRGQRPRLEAETIRGRAIKGVSYGKALLKESVDNTACAIGAVRDVLAADSRRC